MSVQVLLEGLYDPDCSLNLLKMDKDGNAKDYTNILERIWEFTTKWPNWEVLNKACVILIIVKFIINVTSDWQVEMQASLSLLSTRLS